MGKICSTKRRISRFWNKQRTIFFWIDIELGEYNDAFYEVGTNVKITYEGTAKTLEEAGVFNPNAFPKVNEKLIKDNVLFKTKNNKYYFNK